MAIDLFCGLGGWTEGLLAEGFRVIGFDIEQHRYPSIKIESGAVKRPGLNWSDRTKRGSKDAQFNRPPEIADDAEWMEYPGQLVIQDVLTLHGRQFKDAALIVASPPCQEYSYMAMPWSRAKAIAKEYREGKRDVKKLTALFSACFRIQREACEAAGHHIPLVVENVRGAQPWVGRSRWNYGSFHLWGDVPALMPIVAQRRMKSKISCAPRNFSERVAGTPEEAYALHYRLPDGTKGVAQARKAASAAIAKIPFPLAQWIAKAWKPRT